MLISLCSPSLKYSQLLAFFCCCGNDTSCIYGNDTSCIYGNDTSCIYGNNTSSLYLQKLHMTIIEQCVLMMSVAHCSELLVVHDLFANRPSSCGSTFLLWQQHSLRLLYALWYILGGKMCFKSIQEYEVHCMIMR